ncbi:MAG: hypothetical protein M1834_006123 [Cirrosporium novae-zelandiae]|nr:MAG: hypothetical protein M1834_006123 [Cirrosporium novae-zelandiae]
MSSPLSASALFSVKGLVAVITGGATGLGLTMARTLAQNGASKIYIVGRTPGTLASAASSPDVPPGVLIPGECDVTSKASLEALVKRIESEIGYVDVLISNAGIMGPGTLGPAKTNPDCDVKVLQKHLWEEAGVEDWMETLKTNVVGVFFSAVAFLGLLDEGSKRRRAAVEREGLWMGGESMVIVTGSAGGFNRRPLGSFSYAASKAAVTHLTKQLSTVFSPLGIRANVLCPGVFPSTLSSHLTAPRGEPAQRATTVGSVPKSTVPAERWGEEQDIAGAILYLCGRAGAYVNGSVLLVDGGALTQLPATY